MLSCSSSVYGALLLLSLLSLSLFVLFDRLLPPPHRPPASDSEDREAVVQRDGIHVIVGHYVADRSLFQPISADSNDSLSLNQSTEIESLSRTYDGYEPIPGAGEEGTPVFLPSFLEPKQRALFAINRFNILASDRISVSRKLPDVRKAGCRRKFDDESLLSGLRLTVSVVIVFHNEAWSTLLRSVHSVLERSATPGPGRSLLRQLLLVDDASERIFLTDGRLRRYLERLHAQHHPDVDITLMRLEERSGVVGARLAGAAAATGDLLLFLDAHIECAVGWLPPLVHEIQSSSDATIVSPVIDVIQDSTFAFAPSFERHVGGFNWNLHFRWFPAPPTPTGAWDETRALPTPVMAGGLFAVRRDLFWSLGSYDAGMQVWGAENVELSLRAWMCSNNTRTLLIHPCSHVGHLFRRSSPYSFATNERNAHVGVTGVLAANTRRLVDVWMDGHAPFFRLINPQLQSSDMNETSLEERRALRRRLGGCRSFQWFLDSVWGPAHFFPDHDGNKALVQVRSTATALCLEQQTTAGSSSSSRHERQLISLQKCAIEGNFAPQLFVYDKRLLLLMADESLCADVMSSSRHKHLFMNACSPANSVVETDGGRQRMRYEDGHRRIRHVASDTCVSVQDSQRLLTIRECDPSDGLQDFSFLPVPWTSSLA